MQEDDLKCSICYTIVDEILQLDCPHSLCLICACKIYTPPNSIRCLLCESKTRINLEAAEVLARLSTKHRKKEQKSGQIKRTMLGNSNQSLQMSSQTIKNRQYNGSTYKNNNMNTTAKKQRRQSDNNPLYTSNLDRKQQQHDISLSNLKRVSPQKRNISPIQSHNSPTATKKISFSNLKEAVQVSPNFKQLTPTSRSSFHRGREQYNHNQQQQHQPIKHQQIDNILGDNRSESNTILDNKYSLAQLEESLNRLNTSQNNIANQSRSHRSNSPTQQYPSLNNSFRNSNHSRKSSPKLARQNSAQNRENDSSFILNNHHNSPFSRTQQQQVEKEFVPRYQQSRASRGNYLELIKGELSEIENDIKRKSLENLENKSIFSQQLSQLKLNIVQQFQDLKNLIEEKVEQILDNFDSTYVKDFKKFEDIENFYSDQVRLFREFEENALKNYVQSEVKSPEENYDHFLQQKVDFQELVIKLDHFKTMKKNDSSPPVLEVKGQSQFSNSMQFIRDQILQLQGPTSRHKQGSKSGSPFNNNNKSDGKTFTARFQGSQSIQVSPRQNSLSGFQTENNKGLRQSTNKSQSSLQYLQQQLLQQTKESNNRSLLTREKSYSPSRVCRSSIDLINIDTIGNENNKLKEKVENDNWYYKKIQEIKSNERKLDKKNNSHFIQNDTNNLTILNQTNRQASPSYSINQNSPISDALHFKSYINGSKKKHKDIVENLETFQNFRNTRQKNREKINEGLSPSPTRHEKKFGFGNDQSPYQNYKQQKNSSGKGNLNALQQLQNSIQKNYDRDNSLKEKLQKVKLQLHAPIQRLVQ